MNAISATVDGADARVVLVAITRHGAQQVARLARSLPRATVCVAAKFADAMAGLDNPVQAYAGAFKDEIGALFGAHDQIVFFVSLGAVVRLIAPHLRSKDEDPGVIVVDDAAQFVIPVLSGHVGGANAWAERLAALLGATPVLTTASDVGKTIPVDILGRELGWTLEAPKINVTRVSAHVVNGEPVAVVQEAGSPHWWTRPTPLPANIQRFARLDEVDLARFKALLWITHAPVDEATWARLHERLVVYRPPRPRVAVGLGCDRGTPLATVAAALDQALQGAGLGRADVAVLASIDAKADEPAFAELAAAHGWPLRFYAAAQLAAVPVPNPSATVLRHMGTPSVSEAAALLAAGGAVLLVEKYKLRGADGRNATVSLAPIPEGAPPANEQGHP